MSDPVNAEVILAGQVYTHRKRTGRCSCGEQLSAPTDSSYARHIAQMQLSALKLASLTVAKAALR